VREVAGWLGLPVERMGAEVLAAARRQSSRGPGRAQPEAHATTDRERLAGGQPPGNGGESPARHELPRPDLRDPLVAAERQLLQVVLQYPGSLDEGSLEVLPADALRAPAHQVVFEGVRAGGGLATARTVSTQAWAATVSEATRTDARGLVHELAVAPLPVTLEPSSGLPPRRYVDSLLARVLDAGLARRIADAMSALQRAEPGSTQERALNEQLAVLYRERARMRAETE